MRGVVPVHVVAVAATVVWSWYAPPPKWTRMRYPDTRGAVLAPQVSVTVASLPVHLVRAVRFAGGATVAVATVAFTDDESLNVAHDGSDDPTTRPATSSSRIAARRIEVRVRSALMVPPL